MQTKQMIGRIVAGAYEDSQGIRIATKNRIRDIIRKNIEGIDFNKVEEKKEKKTYGKKYTDQKLFELFQKLLEDLKITQEEYDYVMKSWNLVKESEKLENKYKEAMQEFINDEPVYYNFLSKIKGIGEVLSTNLIKEFGSCENYGTVSKLWCHTGNHVTDMGIAPKKRKGAEINYSPRLRTLTWKISDCLMKLNKGIYRKTYDIEKAKQLAREYKPGELEKIYGKPYKSKEVHLRKGHAHNRALRKMRKLFLSHYWACARETAGLDTRELYVKEKLGHKNIITWKQAITAENCLVG